MRWCWALASWLVLVAAPAWSHTGSALGFASIDASGPAVRYALSIALANVPPPLAEAMDMAGGAPPKTLDPLVAAVRDHVRVSRGGKPCVLQSSLAMPPGAGRTDVNVVVVFQCAEAGGATTIRDELAAVFGKDYHTLAHLSAGGRSQQFSFGADAPETTVGAAAGDAASRGAGSFFPLGIEHILTGYDHLLFLVALILRGGNLLQLLKIITAFTIAHSITLGLAALDVVQLPGVFVEAVIALSIAYVAFENLLPKYAISRRWTVSFVFGLIHGFGFSSVLREIGLPKENLVLALLNFNLGVEAGQAAVALVLVPVLLRLRKFDWEPKAVMGVSGVILVVGLWLFAERAFLGG